MSRTYSKNAADTLPLTVGVEPVFDDFYVTVAFFSDAALTTPVTPGAGSVAVTGRVVGNAGYTTFPTGSPITATDTAAYARFSAPLDSVTVTPSGVTGAGYYKVTITATRG